MCMCCKYLYDTFGSFTDTADEKNEKVILNSPEGGSAGQQEHL